MSSAERLSKRFVTGDRAKPVSSTLAHARTAAIATTDAAVDTRYEASVRRAYVTLGLKAVARISALPLSLICKQGCRGATTDSVG